MGTANASPGGDARELGELLAAIVESSDDAIIGVTLDGVITTWNPGAARMIGYTAAEMTGHGVAGLFPPERAYELAPILGRLRHGQRIDHYQSERVRKDGAIIDVSFSAVPVTNADGAVTGAVTVTRDMTGRNRAEAALATLTARLRHSERMETVGQLASGLAHDFNNLFGAIVGYAELVAVATTDRPAVRADLEEIQAAVERASQLTRELLIFSLRPSGRPATVDLNDVIAGVRELITASIGSRVEQRFELAAVPLLTVADRGELEQVLLNLAVNARDATPPGGTVTITTGLADLGNGHRGTRSDMRPGRYVELAVKDTGAGMTADMAARIFEPLFSSKPVGQGTGLGLSTVHELITQAGGTIKVDSAQGAGTTIHVYLPGADVPAPRPGPPDSGRPNTILVVDDEPAMLRSTVRILRNNGYYTLEAESGEEALSLASCHDFQLLLTDSVMPRISGAELTGLISKLKPGVPVLHMSGFSLEGLRQETAGAKFALLEKPFTAETLMEAVRAALQPPPA